MYLKPFEVTKGFQAVVTSEKLALQRDAFYGGFSCRRGSRHFSDAASNMGAAIFPPLRPCGGLAEDGYVDQTADGFYINTARGRCFKKLDSSSWIRLIPLSAIKQYLKTWKTRTIRSQISNLGSDLTSHLIFPNSCFPTHI